MKANLVFPIILILVLAGCASHYYQKNNDTVSLFLRKPHAKRVYFLSSLDGFTPRKAWPVDTGTWKIDAPAKTEFRYFYNVDGAVYLPSCRLKEQDDFGSEICIYDPGL
ncbi:MAG: hypothetical protein JRJ29_12560 [Deltaproteobacteria bacterium]|nr:hypothetical protein [Deltaproteobacteria bacterium]